jgi:hypothetical protein
MKLPHGSTYAAREALGFFAKVHIPAPELEFVFHPERKWRFDFAWPAAKLALEVQGGVHSGGRHTNPQGYLNDMEKENAAACLGWRILKTTPQSLLSFGTAAMLEKALSLKT